MSHRRMSVSKRSRQPRVRAQLVRAHAELQQRYDELRSAEEARERYINCLVHDIRSPLMATHAGIEIVRRVLGTQPLPDFVDEALISSLHSVRSVVELTNDLLDIKRLQAGAPALHCGPVALTPLCADACQVLATLAHAQQLTLQQQIAPGNLTVHGDQRLLQRVLINLLSNAIRFTPPGGLITIAAHSTVSTRVLLRVDDTGPGVPAAERERVFLPFVQGQDQAAHGSGLGLAFCHETMLAHGGRIWVEDRPGGGARFCLDLPGLMQSPL